MSWLFARCAPPAPAPAPVRKVRSESAICFSPFFWASETEPGVWRVQFEPWNGISHVIDDVRAETGLEAAGIARSKLIWKQMS